MPETEAIARTRCSHVVDDLAAVEAALRKIIPADLEQRLLAQIPQWFLVSGMFKDLDLAYSCLEDRSPVEAKYRAALTAILSLGENIFSGLLERAELDLGAIGYSKESVRANLEYLRIKYRRWYHPRDPAAVAATLAAIHGERLPSL